MESKNAAGLDGQLQLWGELYYFFDLEESEPFIAAFFEVVFLHLTIKQLKE